MEQREGRGEGEETGIRSERKGAERDRQRSEVRKPMGCSCSPPCFAFPLVVAALPAPLVFPRTQAHSATTSPRSATASALVMMRTQPPKGGQSAASLKQLATGSERDRTDRKEEQETKKQRERENKGAEEVEPNEEEEVKAEQQDEGEEKESSSSSESGEDSVDIDWTLISLAGDGNDANPLEQELRATQQQLQLRATQLQLAKTQLRKCQLQTQLVAAKLEKKEATENQKQAMELKGKAEEQLREESKKHRATAARVTQLQADAAHSACCICQDARASVLYLPCKHLVVCDACDGHAKKSAMPCVLCRTPINSRHKGLHP